MMGPDNVREWLADPAQSLQAFGWVMGQEHSEPIKYDPFAITHHLQETILGYISDPPVNENGYAQWLVCLKYRQGGASTTGCLGFYPLAQYREGWTHITIADNKERADYLFERVAFCDARWPDEFKVDTINANERRSKSWVHGGKMEVLSGRGQGSGIGRAPDSLLASELPLWADAAGQFNYLIPSMLRRKNALMVLESTPFPMNEPSAEWYMNMCQSASRGKGRFKFAFFPFWDGKLCQEPWPEGSPYTTEEQRLLDKYWEGGLRPEHLAFRRLVMDTDSEIMKRPELFGVFYPFDDIDCWQQSSKNILRWEHIKRAVKHELVEWVNLAGYQEYILPNEGSRYMIGVDPSGHGSRDDASFQVLEVWRDDWRQAACYASKAEPSVVAEKLFEVGKRYNWAAIAVERNGVGTAITTALQLLNYPNIWMDKGNRPGLHKQSDEGLVSDLIMALRNELDLRDKDTVKQLRSYQGDRSVQATARQVLLDRDNPGRRGRHHWDKVSALMIAVAAARTMPQISAPSSSHGLVIPMPGLTIADIDRMAEAQRAMQRRKARSGRKTRYSKRRRR